MVGEEVVETLQRPVKFGRVSGGFLSGFLHSMRAVAPTFPLKCVSLQCTPPRK
jgi:hypothetical protein